LDAAGHTLPLKREVVAMRLVLTVLLTAALAVSASAGLNPDARMYLDFDPPDGVHRIEEPPDPVVNIYVVLDCLGVDSGINGCTIHFERTFGATAHDEVCLIGFFSGGDVEDPEFGWYIVTQGECIYPDANGMIIVGYVLYYYTGPPGYVKIAAAEVAGKEVLDCNNMTDVYCVADNAGIGADPPPGDPGCYCGPVPVEDASWGTIKSLYR
jgi:hypothetical protein